MFLEKYFTQKKKKCKLKIDLKIFIVDIFVYLNSSVPLKVQSKRK